MDPTTPVSQQPIVLLVTPEKQARSHDHTAILSKAGFQVVNHTHEAASVAEIVRLEPRIIIAELGEGGRDAMFNLVRRVKAHQFGRHIPLIVYGVGLTADEIETTAHAGAMWLQLEPTDGYKLLGAVRGVLRAA
jgi:DNA-binding response OmpR family regulator